MKVYKNFYKYMKKVYVILKCSRCIQVSSFAFALLLPLNMSYPE